MKNKVFLITIGKGFDPEVLKFIEKQYGRDTTKIERISTTEKDLKSTIIKKGSEGPVFTAIIKKESEGAVPTFGELSRKIVKKVTKSGATFVEIVKDPNKGMFQRVHSLA